MKTCYYIMSIEDLEKEVNELNKQRMEIIENQEKKLISEEYAKKLYKRYDKKYSELYLLLEKRLSNQYNNFLTNVLISK